MLENRFNYDLEYDYHTENYCEESGCYDEGICRCGIISCAFVTSVNLYNMTNHIYDSIFDKSKSIRRHKRIASILYGGELVDKYCIYRILSRYELYDTGIWNVEVIGGYYGEEIGNVTLPDELFKEISTKCSEVVELETLEDKLRYVLTLEYGYLLPEFEKSNFKIIKITKNDIDFVSSNRNHVKKVKEENLLHYSSSKYDLPRGVVRKLGDKYKIIDGFHRVIGFEFDDKEFEVFCIV